MSFNYDKQIIHRRRKGTINDPFRDLDETLIVGSNAQVVLSEIPSEFHKVVVEGDNRLWKEVKSGIPLIDEYKVDYEGRTITFNQLNIGKQLNFKYKGTGLSFINISSVFTNERDGEVTETLKEFVEQAKQQQDLVWDMLDYEQVSASGLRMGKVKMSYNTDTQSLDFVIED